MSEKVDRYNMANIMGPVMVCSPNGEYVLYTDYERLRAKYMSVAQVDTMRDSERPFACGDIANIIASHEEKKRMRSIQMPDDYSAIRALRQVYLRFQDMGWKDIVCAPKDGTVFEAIEVGATCIQKCMYLGEWPKGVFFSLDDNDFWPCRPSLWRSLGPKEVEK